jgi:hypothetical protein
MGARQPQVARLPHQVKPHGRGKQVTGNRDQPRDRIKPDLAAEQRNADQPFKQALQRLDPRTDRSGIAAQRQFGCHPPDLGLFHRQPFATPA